MYALCTLSESIILQLDSSSGGLCLYQRKISEESSGHPTLLGNFNSFASAIKFLKNKKKESIDDYDFINFEIVLCEHFKTYKDNLYYFDKFRPDTFANVAFAINSVYVQRFSIEIFNLIKFISMQKHDLLLSFLKKEVDPDGKYYSSFIDCRDFINSFDLV